MRPYSPSQLVREREPLDAGADDDRIVGASDLARRSPRKDRVTWRIRYQNHGSSRAASVPSGPRTQEAERVGTCTSSTGRPVKRATICRMFSRHVSALARACECAGEALQRLQGPLARLYGLLHVICRDVAAEAEHRLQWPRPPQTQSSRKTIPAKY